jgi:beta-phosphoglucomutase
MISHRASRRNGTLRGVIFDMDGVIIDSHPAHRRAWQKFLESLGRRISESDLDYILDGRKRNEILHHFFGELSEPEIVEYGSRKDEFFQQALLEVRPIPGVIDFVDHLRQRKIAMAVATSASEMRTHSTLDRLQLARHFKVIVTGNDVAEGKPNPAIYRVACQRLGVSPENALAIEDAVSGIRAARGAGIRCVAVAGHEPDAKLREAGADHVIENFVGFALPELKTALRRAAQPAGSRRDLENAAR